MDRLSSHDSTVLGVAIFMMCSDAVTGRAMRPGLSMYSRGWRLSAAIVWSYLASKIVGAK